MTGSATEAEVDSPLRDASPSEAVVEAVAEAKGVSPLALEQPLYEVVDPDALDALFAGSGGTVACLRFTYQGYAVEIAGDGEISLVEIA